MKKWFSTSRGEVCIYPEKDEQLIDQCQKDSSLQRVVGEFKKYLRTSDINKIKGVQVYELKNDEFITFNIYEGLDFKAFDPIILITTEEFNNSNLDMNEFDSAKFAQEICKVVKWLSIDWYSIVCMNNQPGAQLQKLNIKNDMKDIDSVIVKLNSFLLTSTQNAEEGVQILRIEDSEGLIDINEKGTTKFKTTRPISLVFTEEFLMSNKEIKEEKVIEVLNRLEQELEYLSVEYDCFIVNNKEYKNCEPKEEIIEDKEERNDNMETSFLNELRSYASEAREGLLNYTKETLIKYAKDGHYKCALGGLSNMNDERADYVIDKLTRELGIGVYRDENNILIADWSEN